ncbi:MAG: phosphoribosylamine--glycine ligase [Euryarchaeota archaeon]|nr:phosphoribosylamine--glycine ligase [Euryarchaeota archaeon]
MKVLLLGAGGREHAMAAALVRSGADLVAIGKNRNPGIVRIAETFHQGEESDAKLVVEVAQRNHVGLAVAGPEAPLASGVTDALEDAGIRVASPSKAAAEIETDKGFCRRLLEKHGVPGAVRFREFVNADGLADFIGALGAVAVKPIGLTGGKGVRVSGDHFQSTDEATAYAKEVLDQRIGGARVVVEEKLEGEEFTLMALTDGKTVAPYPAVQDHKRAYEGDKGPNTGGMGSYSDVNGLLPFMTRTEYEESLETLRLIVAALRDEGRTYKGAIYGQFMLTRDGPKVIEVNARFGDPEAMNVLTVMRGSYLEALEAVAHGSLTTRHVGHAPLATVCKYLVPKGYGEKVTSGTEIRVDEAAVRSTRSHLYYAAVNEAGGKVFTTTSRAVGMVGFGDSIEEADMRCEAGLQCVVGEGLWRRRDIGTTSLVDRRVAHMRELRGVARI